MGPSLTYFSITLPEVSLHPRDNQVYIVNLRNILFLLVICYFIVENGD